MKNKGVYDKRLRQIAVNDNHSTEPSIELVAGAGCQHDQLLKILICAYDIAAKPPSKATLLSNIEGVRAFKDADYTSSFASSTILRESVND